MIGIVFLVSLLLFLTVVLCQWSISSRSKGEGWLLNWFPPCALYYAYKHRKEHKFLFVFQLSFLVATFLSCGAWFIVGSTLPSMYHSEQSSESWKTVLEEQTLYLVQTDQLISVQEWQIQHKDLNPNVGTEKVQLSQPKVLHSYQDSATKEFVVEDLSIQTLVLSQQGLSLDLELKGDEVSYHFIADLQNPLNQTLQEFTKADARKVISSSWPETSTELSFKVGLVRAISERQYIAGIQLFDESKLVKEITVSIDIRNGETLLNHRSLIVLRKFLSDYRHQKQEVNATKRITLAEFRQTLEVYQQQALVVTKVDGTTQRGEFLSLEERVINIRKPLGAGTVDVQIPLDLIASLQFEDVEVMLSESISVSADASMLEPESMAPPNGVNVASPENITNETSAQTESLDDPYLALVGRNVLVTKANGQERTGKLIKVTPTKSITIQLQNGGVEIQIPQSEISELKVTK
ncbi:hypothetical protein [Litoribrevibacter albus]|uniref:Uncharacterized protein n=1 Tax=Litoribrevibacter albus TaxID=1473156 RepID=A0AA37SBV5_9GAMM|nr:hypothetical protein [Litoribrevibacter albus]GLQ31894.1 hypothetical protein GCM10007876_23730 [Litoribrevibacter albus]